MVLLKQDSNKLDWILLLNISKRIDKYHEKWYNWRHFIKRSTKRQSWHFFWFLFFGFCFCCFLFLCVLCFSFFNQSRDVSFVPTLQYGSASLKTTHIINIISHFWYIIFFKTSYNLHWCCKLLYVGTICYMDLRDE